MPVAHEKVTTSFGLDLGGRIVSPDLRIFAFLTRCFVDTSILTIQGSMIATTLLVFLSDLRGSN